MNDHEFRYFEERFSILYGENIGRYLANELHRMMECCDCIDNVRFAEVGTDQVKNYNKQMSQGCCGSVDLTFVCENRKFRLGFNFNH